MMSKEGSTKIVNFMTPGARVLVLGCGHISHIVKMNYSFKNLLLHSPAWMRQSKYIVMMTKEGSYSEYVLSSTISVYSPLIAI